VISVIDTLAQLELQCDGLPSLSPLAL
jgi:hypothetical protein